MLILILVIIISLSCTSFSPTYDSILYAIGDAKHIDMLNLSLNNCITYHFIGKSVSSPAITETPKYVHLLDFVAHSWLLQDMIQLMFHLLKLLPFQRLQLFCEADDVFYAVSVLVHSDTKLSLHNSLLLALTVEASLRQAARRRE